MPSGLGNEAAGTIEAVGSEVVHLKAGDRVAYVCASLGAYAQTRIMPADAMVKLPDSIDFETAAAMMMRGLTVQYLFCQTFPLKKGQTILFHAAAGGVGLIACQWARTLGVNMIGTVGSDEKAEIARAYGCAQTINYNQENFVERVRELTNETGVDVVYDSIGQHTFFDSLDCLKPLGMMVSYGNASGSVPPFSLQELSKRGSLFITRPTLFSYTANRQNLHHMTQELFEKVTDGTIKIPVEQKYALQEAHAAHRALEARKTTGSIILVP